MTLLTCDRVTLRYERVTAVDNLSFTVDTGDSLAIVGENGSGKTSLVKAILGLMPVAGGSIRFGDGLKRTQIGYMPQQTARQRDFPAGVREIVLSGCLNQMGLRPYYGAQEKERAAWALRILHIADLENVSYHALSGGQQQRVLLARALCASRRLLLLDEPASGLDPLATQELYRLVADLNRHEGITVLMVSHDIAAAVESASHILHLHQTPLFFGTAEAYRQSDVGRLFLRGVSHD